jgi:hypothetical protein
VQALQSANPDERLVLVGDFNAFAFNDGYVDVMGTIKGTPAPFDEVVLSSADLVGPDLVDLVEDPALVAPDRRYSFVFDGTAQELDHILVTGNLRPFVSRLEYGRSNADFPETYRSDDTRPERISDHDPIVAYFKLPLVTTLAYTGGTAVSIGADLALSASIAGPTAGSVVFTLGSGAAAQSVAASIAAGVADATFTNVQLPPGPHPLTVDFAGDDIYAPASASATVVVSQATALTYTGPVIFEAGSPVALSAVLVAAPQGTPIAGEAVTFTIGATTVAAVTDASGVASASTSLGVGIHTVGVSFAGDPAAFLLPSAASALLTGKDTSAPVISRVTPSHKILWPPNKQMVLVTIGVVVSDLVDPNPACRVTGIASNGGSSRDWSITGPLSVSLRAVRNEHGTARVYTIAVTCTDAAGNGATGTTTLTVPRNRGHDRKHDDEDDEDKKRDKKKKNT